MKIVVLASERQWEEMQSFTGSDCLRAASETDFFSNSGADIFINLQDDAATKNYSRITKPVIINSVITTLAEINAAPNVVRINGWLTFLNRNVWELAGELNEMLTDFFILINKKIIVVPDEPGFVSARVIAMIVNEAYFTLQDEVSTKNEIDTAMKMGTNYPFGPFEWAEKIGLGNIALLLQKLSANNKRYTAASLLLQQSQH